MAAGVAASPAPSPEVAQQHRDGVDGRENRTQTHAVVHNVFVGEMHQQGQEGCWEP